MDVFDGSIAFVFAAAGASELTWEVASRCTCWSDDTKQPQWGHALCGGLGTQYGVPTTIRALFRGRSSWNSHRASGQHPLSEAQLTTPLSVKPSYVDDRVRDRFTVVAAVGDLEAGSVWYPAAKPVPFMLAGVQRAWRVQLQGLDQASRTLPQP